MRVSTWLIMSISKDIMQQIINNGQPCEYANNTFNTIKTTVMGSGYNMTHTSLIKTMKMQRTHYGSVDQYVTAFRDSVAEANRLTDNIAFAPYTASVMSI